MRTTASTRSRFSIGDYAPDTQGRDKTSPCRASCCKTPYGHSTGRDAFPPSDPRACRCHGVKATPTTPLIETVEGTNHE